MAQKKGGDYFSHKEQFSLSNEDTESGGAHPAHEICVVEESSISTLPTPLYTPPAPSPLSNFSQMAHAGEEGAQSSHSLSYAEHGASPSETDSSTVSRGGYTSSPTPKLHIDTNVKAGSFPISSQTTPYSDVTLISGSESGPKYALKMKLEEPSPKKRPRSRSEPPKPLLPPSLKSSVPSSSDRESSALGLQPQSSVAHSASATTPHVVRTPATPSVLSRSGSHKKHHAFVAHNPFTTHHHSDIMAKHDKEDFMITFDQIRTPITRVTPRVAFAPRTEEGGEFSSRDYHTPVRNYQNPIRPPLQRSSSDRRDLRRTENSVQPSVVRRPSLRTDSMRGTDSNIRSSIVSDISDYTEESTTVLESRSDIQDVSHPSYGPQKSPYPTNRRRDPFRHEEDLCDDAKDEPITRASLPRQDTLESSSGYSDGNDDLEKNNNLKKRWPSRLKSKEASTSSVVHFVGSTLPRQLYLHFLLRLPLLYFSRVSRIFEEADLTLPEIKRMALETPQSLNKLKLNRFDLTDVESADIPLEFQGLSATWEFFIDSLLREWKITNIVSGLLLSAILTLLQIDGAASNPFIRFTSLFSLTCSLISLLYGCMYSIRFGTMRKPYKAAEWALEARNGAMIWWNVWVLLAMPAIWLTWSIILYIVCIMSFAWQTTSQVAANPAPLSPSVLLGVRILLTLVLGLGVLYGALILTTFSRYGEVMDRTWKERIDEWADEKATAPALSAIDYLGSTDAFSDIPPVTPPSSASPPDRLVPSLDENHHIRLPPPHELSSASLVKKPSLSKEKRRVRFESPRDSLAESLGESLAFDTGSGSEVGQGSGEASGLGVVVSLNEREN